MSLWYDLEVGQALPPYVSQPLTVTDFVRYQGASGDMNPVHHDNSYARAAGFPSVFAVGMLPAGVLASYLTDIFSTSCVRRFRVQWRAQAWPGDVLTYEGIVEAKRTDASDRLVDLALTVTRQDTQVHLRGWATLAMTD